MIFSQTSSPPTLKDVATLIKNGRVKNVIVMAGAGISTAAGIPDFRTPGTGLYDNLEKYKLPYPEAIFDVDYFVDHPQPFFTLAKELYPGQFDPTATHHFFKLLHDKGILKTVFTQNIDTLERLSGVPSDKIIEAHGSFAEAECMRCRKKYDKDDIREQIMRGNVVYCSQKKCANRKEALVKPKIVFFGEGLPEQFFSRLKDFSSCDLLLVMGTSLTVQPFASLIERVPSKCPRVLLNMEVVGEGRPGGFDFEGKYKRSYGIRDVKFKGTSDAGVRLLARHLDWERDLDALIEGYKGANTKQYKEYSKNSHQGQGKDTGDGNVPAAPSKGELDEEKHKGESRLGAQPRVPDDKTPSSGANKLESTTKEDSEKESEVDELADEIETIDLKKD